MDRYEPLCPLVYGTLKTERRRKRLLKKELEKKLIALGKERNTLRRAQYMAPPVELEEPVRKGWKRYFVLREDVARQPKAAFFQNILDKINTVEYSKDKKFSAKKRKKRSQYIIRTQKLRPVYEHEFTHPKRAQFTEKEREYFVPAYFRYSPKDRYHEVFFFVQPWRFVLKIEPHWITHVKAWDQAAETRLLEITRYLEKENLMHKMIKLNSGRVSFRHDERMHIRAGLYTNKPFTHFLEMYEDEKQLRADLAR